jgi:hypothetical protein
MRSRRQTGEVDVPTTAEVIALMVVTNAGLRRAHGPYFPLEVAPWKRPIEKVMQSRQSGAAEACVACCERLKQLGHLDAAARNWLIAATSELHRGPLG